MSVMSGRPAATWRSMRLPDPERSSAVLIGVGQSDHFADIPAALANVGSLMSVLTDPDLGGLARSRCAIVANPAEEGAVVHSLRGAADAADDMLLVYYVGHG